MPWVISRCEGTFSPAARLRGSFTMTAPGLKAFLGARAEQYAITSERRKLRLHRLTPTLFVPGSSPTKPFHFTPQTASRGSKRRPTSLLPLWQPPRVHSICAAAASPSQNHAPNLFPVTPLPPRAPGASLLASACQHYESPYLAVYFLTFDRFLQIPQAVPTVRRTPPHCCADAPSVARGLRIGHLCLYQHAATLPTPAARHPPHASSF